MTVGLSSCFFAAFSSVSDAGIVLVSLFFFLVEGGGGGEHGGVLRVRGSPADLPQHPARERARTVHFVLSAFTVFFLRGFTFVPPSLSPDTENPVFQILWITSFQFQTGPANTDRVKMECCHTKLNVHK